MPSDHTDNDLDAGTIEAQLRRLKPAVADEFTRVSGLLAFDEQALLEWQSHCWRLADAGWHGWEAANDYIRLSSRVALEPQQLLAVGRYCSKLVGNSFEPGRSYINGIAQSFLKERPLSVGGALSAKDSLLAEGSLSAEGSLQAEGSRLLIEVTGLVVVGRFQQASNLHASYFKTAFQIAQGENVESLDAWCQLVSLTCELDRQSLLALLELSNLSPSQDWPALFSIAEYEHDNALGFLRCSCSITHSVRPIESELLALALEYSRSHQKIDSWLTALTQTLPLLKEAESRVLLEAMQQLDNVTHATALIETAEQLPLQKDWIVLEWLSNRPSGENEEVIKAYLCLASSSSESFLLELQGKLQLHEEQRSLQLFIEGLCGTRLRLEVGEGLPHSDGVVIRLPPEISIYAEREANHRWLKTALVHQLGCYEFGTFTLRSKGTVAAFAHHFRQFEQAILAETIFEICEAARIDWRIEQHYRGSAADLKIEKAAELMLRQELGELSPRQQLLEALVHLSLDSSSIGCVDITRQQDIVLLEEYLSTLKNPLASVEDSMDVMALCYAIVCETPVDVQPIGQVRYRGTLPFDDASINLQLTALEDMQAEMAEEFADDDSLQIEGMADESDVDVDELEPGDVDDPTAVMPADDDLVGDNFEQVDDPTGLKQMERLLEQRQEKAEVTYRYDEWDHTILDYRRRWCTLFEFRDVEQDVDFVPAALAEHRALATRVRRQLNMLRPELLRKVKGVEDGEELDLERAIEAVVDRKSGISPSEHIYIQRQRKERDVSALFLLDMSASTDDLVEPEPTVYVEQDDDYLHGFSFDEDEPKKERGKTILDLEKESVVLMAEALEDLGDSYAVCGFSGYGRDRVEYYVCKDFDEPYNYQAKANIGGIKPCRSTRMGPAIRHATKMLAGTESRIKALIIISDGYPQDFDYGQDRNSKDYGVKDTTKALTEASQKGVQSFCLTVDPSGHDYLREMCPDQQYMVMQDITQLPDELSKVYRGLTT